MVSERPWKGIGGLLGFLLLLPFPPSAPAQNKGEWRLDLPALIQEALEQNPEVQAARKQWEAAEARVPQARTLPDPHIEIEPKTVIGGQFHEVGYTVAQKLPFPGKLRLQGEVASKEAERARAEYMGKQREIASKVKSSYYQLFLAHKAIEIKQAEIELLKAFSKLAEGRYEVGKAAQQDVLKAQTVLAGLLNDLVTLEQEKETAAAALNTLLNRPPDAPLGVPETPQLPRFLYTFDQLQRLALKNRADLQAAGFSIEAGEAAHNLAKRQYYPDFGVELEYNQVRKGLDAWSMTVSINIPWLFTRGRYDAQVIEAQAKIEGSRAAYRAIQNRALFEVKDLWVKIQTAERLATLYRTAILPLAEQTLQASMVGYQTGQVDFLTLLENQRTLKAVELAYYQSLVAFYQRVADLERAVGQELR